MPGCPSRAHGWTFPRFAHLVLLAQLSLLALVLLAGQRPAQAQDGSAPLALLQATLITPQGLRTVTLPHTLDEREVPAQGVRVRYRLALERPAGGREALGVYVPKISLSGALRVNGAEVGRCAPVPLELQRCLHQPQLFVVPAELLREGMNQLEFEVYATPHQTNGLSRVVVGDPAALLAGEYGSRRFWQVVAMEALTWITVGVGLLSLAVAVALPRERLYLWFGLACLANVLSNVNVLVVVIPFDTELYSLLVFSARMVSGPLFFLSLLRFFGNRWVPVQAVLVASVPLLPLAIWLSGNDRQVVAWLYLPMLVLVVAAGLASLRWTWQSRSPRQGLMAGAVMLLMAAAVADWLRLRGASAFEGVYLLSYANAGTLLVMGGLIINRLTGALKGYRDLSAALETRVTERERELRAAWEDRLALQEGMARAEARTGLLRELNDGLGAQLAGARLMLGSGQLSASQAARVIGECIDDLHLLLDTAGNQSGSLRDAMADWRHRIEPRLAAAGVASQWRVALEGEPVWRSTQVLSLMRILQEAVSNALRHARARRLSVTVRWDVGRDELTLDVSDDGVGLPGGAAGGRALGRGLPAMRSRAASLGAELTVASQHPGTRVHLRLAHPARGPAD